MRSVRFRRFCFLSLASSAIALVDPALAQTTAPQASDSEETGEIIVTATRREESIQKIPISIQALGSQTLDQHQVASLDDYSKLLPSVSVYSFGPSQGEITIRGANAGPSFNPIASGPPTVGLYIDEIPVSTVGGSVDLHIYDIARVEALSGPQGTLFGASSLAGTVRIITNKPDTSKFEGGIDVQFNKFGKGDAGGQLETFLNLPISDRAALRLVGFYQRDGGYIDNVRATRTFTLGDNNPATNVTVNNANLVENDYNDVDTYGGRAALKIDLDDSWTVTPAIIYQHQVSHGNFSFDKKKGDLKVSDFRPTRNLDRFYQAALTIEGKISDFDLVYSGGYFERRVNTALDYSYYSVAYDQFPGYTNFPDGNGGFLDPTQSIFATEHYTKFTQEARLSSPTDNRFRVIAGLFYQRQTNKDNTDFSVQDLSKIVIQPRGFGDDIFARRLFRVDTDYAAFAEANFDITDTLKLTGGIRGFKAKNSLFGFSGFASNVVSTFQPCLPTSKADRPCNNIDKRTSESGETHKVSLAWQATPDQLFYATYATGFRPGGNNRLPGVPPFKSDRLSNYELGTKLGLFDRKLKINAAIFYERLTKLQFSLAGVSGITSIFNAGSARVYGAEADFALSLGGMTLSGSGSYIDSKLASAFCEGPESIANGVCKPGGIPSAPKGTRLPLQPRFKGSLTARYAFDVGGNQSFVQGSLNYRGSATARLFTDRQAAIGSTPAFATFDFSVGTQLEKWKVELFMQNAFDKRGELNRTVACSEVLCGPFKRTLPIKPQNFGLKLGTRF
ncbi:MAG: TonB-dependent receptor [Sphingomonadales bacterium]|nr:TonB-dependent receptor [Sphingomonadales bacterium]